MTGLRQDPAVFPRVLREGFSTVRGDCFHRVEEDICRQTNESIGSTAQAYPVCIVTDYQHHTAVLNENII